MKHIKISLLVLALTAISVFAQDTTQVMLPIKSTGVAEFLSQHPKYDGRGTIVFIFDTGVDMGIDGLKKTSTGETKVIDVQDFTGEGDVKYYEADIDDEDGKQYFENEDHNIKVYGVDSLSLKSKSGDYFIGSLNEELWKNSGSRVKDLNGNGTTNDSFDFIVFDAGDNDWVLYIDKNDNGTLADEKPIRNYKVNRDYFVINNEEKGLTMFTFGINIFPTENKVSFFFDDGGHGTHCAGIATGYHIGGTDLNGVAPGANVIALKLGNNNFAGGATVTESMRNCFLYADKVSKEQEKPCVINMSFGIGSEIEGRSVMEKFIDSLVAKNHYLYICNSNGNEGPGISTTGLPASSPSLFSSGAILAKEVGHNLYATVQDRDQLTYFSSRGGEVMKPDVASPGASVSTVPNFMHADRMWGTSMASPYSTGVMALLLSAMRQEYPDVKIPSLVLYNAIREGAKQLPNYDRVDQGAGEINVINAYNILKKYIKQGILKSFETYTTKAFAETMPDETSQALYIRNGNYITKYDKFSFRIKRNNFINNKKFYRTYRIKSDKDWLIPLQRKVHFRNSQPATVNVRFDKSKMKQPGMYNGTITAYRTDGTNLPEIQMMATVVFPYEFTPENNYKQEWKNVTVAPGELHRYFINVPAGATSMTTKLSGVDKKYALVWYLLSDNTGRQFGRDFYKSEVDGNPSVKTYEELKPGVYELDMLGYYGADGVSTYNLSVSFESAERLNPMTLSKTHNKVTVINRFNFPESYKASGTIEGFKKTHVFEIKAGDTYSIPVTLYKAEAGKKFEVEISKDDFNKVTDFALMIYDKDGKAVALGGLSYATESLELPNSSEDDSTKYTFTLIPAFAEKVGKITVHVTEITELKKTTDVFVTSNGSNRFTLFPSQQKEIKCNIKKPDYNFPKDVTPFGEIILKSGDKTKHIIPVTFQF
jgi:subtilisin family serine protease